MLCEICGRELPAPTENGGRPRKYCPGKCTEEGFRRIKAQYKREMRAVSNCPICGEPRAPFAKRYCGKEECRKKGLEQAIERQKQRRLSRKRRAG